MYFLSGVHRMFRAKIILSDGLLTQDPSSQLIIGGFIYSILLVGRCFDDYTWQLAAWSRWADFLDSKTGANSSHWEFLEGYKVWVRAWGGGECSRWWPMLFFSYFWVKVIAFTCIAFWSDLKIWAVAQMNKIWSFFCFNDPPHPSPEPRAVRG